MSPRVVTDNLLHELVAGSHAQGVTALDVTATIEHHGHILLLAEPGRDFIDDDSWQLPTGTVLAGETLDDALAKTLAVIGLDLDKVTSYLGHHDHHDPHGLVRTFCFAVTVTRPDSICRSARIGHRWAEFADLPDLLADIYPVVPTATTTPARPRECHAPRLAQPLRTHAQGLCALQAGTELFIRHGTWLRRSDFCDQFVHLDHNIVSGTEIATIDWATAITALERGQLPCSSSEEQMLRLAASLIEGTPISLRDTLVGLDDRNLDLVSQAVQDTAGH